MNFYARHIGDYLKDTAHLSLLHHGIYARLMDVYYTRECGFNEGEAHRLIGARTKDERAATDEVLAEFFTLQGEVWIQGRCDAEIAAYRHKQELAKRSADARWSKSERNANASASGHAEPMRSHSGGNAPNPIPIPNPRKEQGARGSRLPQDWKPDEELERFAREQQVDPALELAKFRDYWAAQPGQKGVKLDWPATWRNWCRNAKKNPADVVRITTPSAPPSKFLAEQAAHRAAVEADRIARKQRQAA